MIYFEKPGKANSEATVAAALEAAERYNIKKIVVASAKGDTANTFLNCGHEVTVVTHQ